MIKEKILIFGAGFIGSRIAMELNECKITDKRIHSFKDIEEEIEEYKPDIIINCIGHTGKHNVDDCELNKDKTLFSNAFIPILFAEVCLRYSIKLVHLSSGCIYHYDYSKSLPIDEAKEPDFFDLFYSRSKIYSERALATLCKDFPILIVRVRIPLDNIPHPKNLLTKLIKYKKVIILPNSVSYIPDTIEALKHLIKIDAKGIFNVVNKGGLYYPDLMEVYKRYDVNFEYQIVDFKSLNITRTNLILSVDKLENTGFKVRNIKDVLEECVKKYIENSKK